MRLYLASSWRNPQQPAVLAALRDAGHEVYDFRNPAPGDHGFGWRQVDPELHDDLTTDRLRRALAHPAAERGFRFDFDAMKAAEAFVLLLPCGRSAHLEAGWAAGAGKPVAVLGLEITEPELMYKCFADFGEGPGVPLFDNVEEVCAWLSAIAPAGQADGLTDRERQLYDAIRYTLDRSQTDPDLGYLVSPGTETFERLCAAEAAVTGQLASVIKVRRGVDLQPRYRRRRPDVVVLRERVELLERRMEENGVAGPPVGEG